jgi:serine/threonine protein kinase
VSQGAVTKIGKYEVVEILGKGGMGVVYKAMDPRIGRLVAIKMMTGGFAENPDLLKRFYREAQSTGMLQHPNIVIVYDLGDQEGNPYLVMEFLEGEALDKKISRREEISIVDKIGYIIQACNGLNYAHQRGIVHRDIKPANLMLLKNGDVKIVDFGIARIGDTSLTRTGQVVGTITYMSPEQINAKVVDGRTDIFSLGVVLYELLTYSLPFDGKDTASTLLKIIHEPPPPLKNYLPVYPPELEEVVLRALAKERDDRYSTAEDLAFDLSRIQDQLKKQMVSDYVDRAKTLVEKQDFTKAKEVLQQVLKVDTQHSLAKELMHEVQQRLQRQQRGEQLRQLRSHAEDAFHQKSFEDALNYLDQALALDKTDPDLLNFRDVVQVAKEKKVKFEAALKRAEQLEHGGDLEGAVKAAEEALEVQADSTQAKALHAQLSKAIAERQKQQQLEGLLENARKEISSRHFTGALDLLKQAQLVDATSPEVHALLNLAGSGREQEQRRRELEKFASDIEDALARDDYDGACAGAEAALQKYPSDPGLLKLKTLAERQRESGAKKKFIEEQMTAARRLLDAGKPDEAMAVLERATQRVPGDARLQSLLAIVRDNAEREKMEKAKNAFLHDAREALRKKDYAAAVRILENARAEVEGSAEIVDLLQFAKDEAASQTKRKKIDDAAGEAQRLIAEQDYERAVALLEATVKEVPDEELKVVLTEARRHVDEFNRQVEQAIARARRLMEARKLEEAVQLLEAQPKTFARSTEFCATLEKARTEHDQLKAVTAALDKARAAVAKNDFANAMVLLEACKKNYGETPEYKTAKAEIDQKRVAVARVAVEKAVNGARTMLLARQYAAALRDLETAAALVSAAPPELQKQYEAIKRDASAGASRLQKEADLSKTVVSGSELSGAQTIIAGSVGESTLQQPAYVPPGAPPAAAPRPGVAPVAPPRPAPRAVAPAPPPPRKSPIVLIAAAIVAVAVIVGGIYLVKRVAAPPKASTYIEINAIPWGTVTSIVSKDGKVKLSPNDDTPLRIPVPPGDYTVTVTGPGGKQLTEDVTATDELPGSTTRLVFQQIDVEKIVNEH